MDIRSWGRFKEAIPVDKVESLRQVYEGYKEWLPLYPTFFLKLPEREHHVDGGPVGSEPALGARALYRHYLDRNFRQTKYTSGSR